jgi:predicted transcriptional regulator
MARPPKSKTERKGEMLAAQVDSAMKKDLEDIARERDWPVSLVIREALRQYLDRQKTQVTA